MMNKVYCKMNSKGQHTFFLRAFGEDYYLFSQKFNKKVDLRFGKGMCIDEALNRGVNNHIIRKTAEKILHYLGVVEKENNVIFLEKRARKIVTKYQQAV